LDIDGNLLKGHFFLGQGLMEIDNYDEAIKHLQRGKSLMKNSYNYLEHKRIIFLSL